MNNINLITYTKNILIKGGYEMEYHTKANSLDTKDSRNKMEVRCNVDTCEYWKDNYCSADSLKVDPMGNNKQPNTSDETCCTTFKPA